MKPTKEEKTIDELCKEWNEAHAKAKVLTNEAEFARNREYHAWTALRNFLDKEHKELESK